MLPNSHKNNMEIESDSSESVLNYVHDYPAHLSSLLAAASVVVVLYILIKKHKSRGHADPLECVKRLKKAARGDIELANVIATQREREQDCASATEIQIDGDQFESIELEDDHSQREPLQLHYSANMPSGWQELMTELVNHEHFRRSCQEIADEVDDDATARRSSEKLAANGCSFPERPTSVQFESNVK